MLTRGTSISRPWKERPSSACVWLNAIYGESGISGNTAGASSQSRVPPAKLSHLREEVVVVGGHPSGCGAPCLTRCIY